MTKLTKATVAKLKLPAGQSDAIYFDDDLPGFGLRLRRAASAVGSCNTGTAKNSAA